MTHLRNHARLLALFGAAAALSVCGPARATVTAVDGGTAAPASTLGSYTMTSFPADTVNPLFAETTSIPTPLGSPITLSSSLEHAKIGQGWGTWSNGYTGDVYDVLDDDTTDVVTTAAATSDLTDTLTLPSATGAFYLYFEPDEYASFDMTVTASDGTTTTQDVSGLGGAAYFGFYASSGESLDTLTVSSSDVDGYAIGEFGISATQAVPEPTTLGLTGVAAIGLLARRRRAATAR